MFIILQIVAWWIAGCAVATVLGLLLFKGAKS